MGQPGGLEVTVIALAGGDEVVGALASGSDAVVATRASSRYHIVMVESRGLPGDGGVATITRGLSL